MADAPNRGTVTQNMPSISWDPAKCAFRLTLMGIELKKIDDPKQGYKFDLPMPVLYDIRLGVGLELSDSRGLVKSQDTFDVGRCQTVRSREEGVPRIGV